MRVYTGGPRPRMQPQPPPYDPPALDAFVALAGPRLWAARMAEIGRYAACGPRAGQAIRQRHALELAIERLRGTLTRPPSVAELHAARLAGDAVTLSRALRARGRGRLHDRLRTALAGDGTLVPIFHMLRTAALQVSRGFSVAFAGLEDDAPYDLLIARGCVPRRRSPAKLCRRRRGGWCTAGPGRIWLIGWTPIYASGSPPIPGRYLLKMTLPQGLMTGALAEMHSRIQSPAADPWPPR